LIDHPGEEIADRELRLEEGNVIATLFGALLADVIFRLLVVHDLREVDDRRSLTA
jgi:hypothetical protein